MLKLNEMLNIFMQKSIFNFVVVPEAEVWNTHKHLCFQELKNTNTEVQ